MVGWAPVIEMGPQGHTVGLLEGHAHLLLLQDCPVGQVLKQSPQCSSLVVTFLTQYVALGVVVRSSHAFADGELHTH